MFCLAGGFSSTSQSSKGHVQEQSMSGFWTPWQTFVLREEEAEQDESEGWPDGERDSVTVT